MQISNRVFLEDLILVIFLVQKAVRKVNFKICLVIFQIFLVDHIRNNKNILQNVEMIFMLFY